MFARFQNSRIFPYYFCYRVTSRSLKTRIHIFDDPILICDVDTICSLFYRTRDYFELRLSFRFLVLLAFSFERTPHGRTDSDEMFLDNVVCSSGLHALYRRLFVH